MVTIPKKYRLSSNLMIRKPNEISFTTISHFRKIVGIILGLCYALLLYAFQISMRELMRVASTSELNEMWLLSKEEVAFYNWFAAALALLIGQSVCVGFWFSRPKRYNERGMRTRSALLNDQVALQANFLMWFLKLGFVFALFFGLTVPNYHVTISFYPTYTILPVLIIITLFLQSWKTIRLKWRKQSAYWMPLAFIGLILSSWSLSKIQVVDYESANEKILSENVWYSNDLQLPEIEGSKYTKKQDEFTEVYLFYRISEDTNKLVVKHNDEVIVLDQEASNFSFFDSFFKQVISDHHYLFYMDKRLKMGTVSTILHACYENEIDFISFAVLPMNREFPVAAYRGFEMPYNFEMEEESGRQETTRDFSPNQLKIEHRNRDEFLLNGQPIIKADLQDELYSFLIKETENYLVYTYSKELLFDDYIQFNNTLNKAIDQFRDDYSWLEYGRSYSDLENYDKKGFDINHPIQLKEIRFNDQKE